MFLILSTLLYIAVASPDCSPSRMDAFCKRTSGPASYCKTWNTPNVCQGTDIPCECEPLLTCEALCLQTEGCFNGNGTWPNGTHPGNQTTTGSYCKTWQDPSVCFGLYWIDESETEACYEPYDPEYCDKYELSPVLCEKKKPLFHFR